MRSFCVILTAFLCLSKITAAQFNFEKGVVYDTVPVVGTPGESFALYLPESFSGRHENSIVFIFDPAARGAIGVRPFIIASEKYGHILICSNNSKNAPYETNFKLANRLFAHIFSKYNIKSDAIYAAGFSGGSRLASAIASLTNQFAGVVGCGAGFSGVQEQMPTTQAYAYAGLCGDRDMNFGEMVEDREYLGTIGFNSTLFTYNGEHSWPPASEITRAFDWLHLQKLKKEQPMDTSKIMEHYLLNLETLVQLNNEKKPIQLAEEYQRILENYTGLISMDSIRQEYAILKQSKPFKGRKKALGEALSKEKKWFEVLRQQFSKDFEGDGTPQFEWWRKELGKLGALAKKDDPELQKMVYRIKFDLYARAFTRKNWLVQTANKNQIAFLNRFLEILYPPPN